MLSVAIITINERQRLSDCLESVRFADDVVVVDSGSTDGTMDMAKAFGARVMVEQWQGFAAQKQLAVDRCRHDWVLILDSDERVPEQTAKAIRQVIASNDDTAPAFSFKRKNYFHGKWIRHCGWWPDRVVRLVDRRRGCFNQRAVHEKWLADGEVRELDVYIEHRSFRNCSDLVAKMERYSSLSAEELFEKGAHASPLTPVTHGLWTFFKTYVLQLGVLEGFEGMLISATNAGGSFLKYAKLREKRLL